MSHPCLCAWLLVKSVLSAYRRPRDGAGSRRLAGVARAMDGGARLRERAILRLAALVGSLCARLRRDGAAVAGGCDAMDANNPEQRAGRGLNG